MNKCLSKIIRNKVFYKFWKKLNELSYYGMNFGVASGYADYSGELYIIKKVCKYHQSNKKKEGIIFDVGANKGEWSKFVISNCNNYNLYLFEPMKSAYQYIKNNYSNKKIYIYFN